MNILDSIREELKLNIDDHTKNTTQRFFKEKVKVYGIKTAIVTKISKKFFNEIKSKNKKEIFDLCEELFKSGYIEESFIAGNWSYYINKDYEINDFNIFENWIMSYVNNWASCDSLCNHTLGAIIEKYPQCVSDLKKWTQSENKWVRRGAAVSLIVPAKKGKFLPEIFEISDLLLLDEEDLVQKGYGWMLKVASQVYQKEVFDYIMKNKKEMPRTALRYAIEKMPKELKEKAIKKES